MVGITRLELRTALGPVYRDVLPYPPRDCTADEIPVIDLAPMFSDELSDRKRVAADLRSAATNNGFFYIKNHGISDETIARCKQQVLNFMRQPQEKKDLLESRTHSKYYNGYLGNRKAQISRTETADVRESFSFRYSPELDPDHPMDISEVSPEVRSWIRGEDFVWEGTAHLLDFKKDCLAYWSSCLTLARRLVRIFALSLDLSEDYWDDKITHPGADGVFNYYPPRTEEEVQDNFVGLGSHTDLQLFTLLWQDSVGGLQILSKEGQWLRAPPIEGTLVVNIGDFMMRLCNDIYKSTVHRVTNESPVERVSMPFFFGLNFNCVEGVVPSCTSESNPAKYEPISCGDWCQMRFKMERSDFLKSEEAKKNLAPSGRVVAV
ncbi:Clavaminate synthase-like protein [Annulohypoxylon truncatum]|uniref:Clavaminate synthase-like protein n=1 Tax=Annulohypoxylon truncatum TaxID=327061 RepID=UPI002007458D|nr:Clavaminate synthase-like protein [Annulohypoxylon truncatum]KAI1214811.1 Clavaminate synthase-like protein [Annulohypoxylon truncatum]